MPERLATRHLVPIAIAICAVLALPAAAAAGGTRHDAFLPPHHGIFHGVTDTDSVHDFHVFNHRVGAHSALLQSFGRWGGRHLGAGFTAGASPTRAAS